MKKKNISLKKLEQTTVTAILKAIHANNKSFLTDGCRKVEYHGQEYCLFNSFNVNSGWLRYQ
jgi:hypothetical protein